MSQNKNYANYYDYDTGRTKTKVNQQPGGNSSLSLAWDAEPVIRNNTRNNYSVPKQYQEQSNQGQGARYQSPYQQSTSQSLQQEQYQTQQQSLQKQLSQTQQQYSNQSTQQQSSQYQSQQNPTQQPYPQQFSGASRRTEYNMGADGSERTSVKVAQQPGGNSNIIFGDYNHFKDDQSSNHKPPRANQFARQQQQSQPFSPIQNTYSNVINNFNPQQQDHQRQYQPQQNDQRNQVRVNQPPGGKSNFTIG